MMNKLVFEKEEDASGLLKDMQGVEIEGKKASLSLEEECVYLSLYNKVHDQKTQQQMQGMDPNQMMMMNMMFMNPFLMMPFMQQQGDQMPNFQKNKFFIRKSADPPSETPLQQSIIEEKITIQKKEPRKTKAEPERRESMRSNKTGKVVYYDTQEQQGTDTKIEMNLDQEEDKAKEVKVQYGLAEMVRIFQGIDQKALGYSSSLDAFKEDGIVEEAF